MHPISGAKLVQNGKTRKTIGQFLYNKFKLLSFCHVYGLFQLHFEGYK